MLNAYSRRTVSKEFEIGVIDKITQKILLNIIRHNNVIFFIYGN